MAGENGEWIEVIIRTGEFGMWEIGMKLTKRSRKLIPERRGGIWKERSVIHREDDEPVWPEMKNECCEEAEQWWVYDGLSWKPCM